MTGARTEARRDPGAVGDRSTRRTAVGAGIARRTNLDLDRACAIAESVVDPELPMLTLADLGVLRCVAVEDGVVVATVTPTFSGCPAMEAIRSDLAHALRCAGFAPVRVETVLDPPWSTDRITARGRQKLAEFGISPPGPAPSSHRGEPVPLVLRRTPATVTCPQCGSASTTRTSAFGPTACRELWVCADCREPFEHVKEL